MKSLAIIPARGGSKRFPKKNIVKFKNHPIISYTIEAAIRSNCFEKVRTFYKTGRFVKSKS